MKNILDILESVGGFIKNSHIIGTSGKHLSEYLNKDALYPHTQLTSEVCQMMAEKVKDLDVDVVVGPAMGGVILSQWLAYHLSLIKKREILSVFTEKKTDGEGHEFKRGYDKFVKEKSVLIVEDILTTGGSAKNAIEAVKKAGGKPMAIIVLVNRSPESVDENYFGISLFTLESRKFNSYEEADCPMCQAGVAINTTVGHGKKYLESKKNK